MICKYASVDTCIWWHEDLQSPTVNGLLAQRLVRVEEILLGEKKKILNFKPYRERERERLSNCSISPLHAFLFFLTMQQRGEEVVSLNYGKLMERLLYFKQQGQDADGIFKELLPLAEQKLRQLSLELQSPVVVLGDASFSMDVAIRVSVIMSSIVAALSRAELRFFNSVSVRPPVVPQTAADVLEVGDGGIIAACVCVCA